MDLGRPTVMVVFGAGASYDSISIAGHAAEDIGTRSSMQVDQEARPPLTDELLSRPRFLSSYMGERRGARALAASVASRVSTGGQSLEEILTSEYEASRESAVLVRGFTSFRFYLRDLFHACTTDWPRRVGGVTNYQWFVRELEKWRSRSDGYVCWVTFNYDGLLDRALEDVYQYDLTGGATGRLEAYIAHPDWCLAKLHGSWDWRRHTGVYLAEGLGTGDVTAIEAELERRWDAAADPPVDSPQKQTAYARLSHSQATQDRALWIPALMAPLASKAAFECPPGHVSHIQQQLPSVDVIYTVGWRAQEEHFLKLLNSMKANPPDVLSLTSEIRTGREVARRVGFATAQRNWDEHDPKGPTWASVDYRLQQKIMTTQVSFSGLATSRTDLSTALGAAVDRARSRRSAKARQDRELGERLARLETRPDRTEDDRNT